VEYPHLNINGRDFFFIPGTVPSIYTKTIVDLCDKRIPATYGYNPITQIQVLTPARKGPAGVLNLNIELQKVLNPSHSRKNEKVSRNFILREGDRIMQIRNNYNLRWRKLHDEGVDGAGVFNGDTGIVQQIDSEQQRVIVLFEDEKIVEYDFGILDEIEPAYAVTVHKSQGSEFPVVIMPVFPGPPVLMTRNLLYTAVTRAKDLVVLVGSENTLRAMVENNRETLRYSGLADKLCRIGFSFA
jgi:exodeoxyribonuclease V alpha subunit